MQLGSLHAVSILLLLTTLVLFGNSQRLKKDDDGLFGFKKRLRSLQSKADDPDDCCNNLDKKPSSVTLRVTGDPECDFDANSQGSDKFDCDGTAVPNMDGSFTIDVTDDKAELQGGGDTRNVQVGDTFTIVPSNGDFDSGTEINVGGQMLDIHTSCSAPLIIGEIFGALTLVNVIGDDGDENEVMCAVCIPGETVPNEGCDDDSDKPFCYNDECVGCVNTGTGDEADMFCDVLDEDPHTTQCDAPQDEAGCDCFCCIDDAPGNGQDSGCPTSTPLCKAKNQGEGVNKDDNEDSCCAVCINNKPGSFPDTGCNETTPVCIDTDKPLKPFDFGDECAVCDDDMPGDHQDSGCPKDLPLCEVGETRQCRTCINNKRGGLRDSGCPEHCTICDASEDEFGDECRVCQNDRVGGGQDSGCPATKKLCITDNNDELGGYGDECALCANDFDFANSIPDSGCDDPDRPVCCPVQDLFGYECVTCKNNQEDEPFFDGSRMLSGHVDTGCSPNAPFCNGEFFPDECQKSKGSGCFVCKNTNGPSDPALELVDQGCSLAAPICVAPPDDYGLECSVCINNADVDGIDTGCSAKHPVCSGLPHKGGHQCGTCRNDQPGNETDSGCTDPEFPLCGADSGDLGSKCFKCSNDCPGDHQDTGCTSDFPICDALPHKYGKVCLPIEQRTCESVEGAFEKGRLLGVDRAGVLNFYEFNTTTGAQLKNITDITTAILTYALDDDVVYCWNGRWEVAGSTGGANDANTGLGIFNESSGDCDIILDGTNFGDQRLTSIESICDGKFYFAQTEPDNALGLIDLNDNTVSEIGTFSVEIDGMAYDVLSGVLLGSKTLGIDQVYSIDPETANLTLKCNLFGGDGMTFGAVINTTTKEREILLGDVPVRRLDLETCTTTILNPPITQDLDSMTFANV